jgi:hypothetical protein
MRVDAHRDLGGDRAGVGQGLRPPFGPGEQEVLGDGGLFAALEVGPAIARSFSTLA